MLSKIQAYFDNLFGDPGEDSSKQVQTIELATAALLIEISLADSDIQDEEINVIEKSIANSFNLEPQQITDLISIAREEVDKAVSLYEFTQLLNECLNQQQKIHIVENLWRIAFADQVLDKYEEYYVRKIADLLHVSHADYIKAKHKATEH